MTTMRVTLVLETSDQTIDEAQHTSNKPHAQIVLILAHNEVTTSGTIRARHGIGTSSHPRIQKQANQVK